jgi:4-hydroxy-tetrahydrodipicolinate reductase
MKIALIGHGAMGQLVAKLAAERHHEVVLTLDEPDATRSTGDLSAELSECEVAIDFSVAAAVQRNIELCMLAEVPLVVGTRAGKSIAMN